MMIRPNRAKVERAKAQPIMRSREDGDGQAITEQPEVPSDAAQPQGDSGGQAIIGELPRRREDDEERRRDDDDGGPEPLKPPKVFIDQSNNDLTKETGPGKPVSFAVSGRAFSGDYAISRVEWRIEGVTDYRVAHDTAAANEERWSSWVADVAFVSPANLPATFPLQVQARTTGSRTSGIEARRLTLGVDASPPALVIAEPGQNAQISASEIGFSFPLIVDVDEQQSEVREVTYEIAGVTAGRLPFARQNANRWSAQIFIQPGAFVAGQPWAYTIRVACTNTAGLAANAQVTITAVDDRPPTLSIAAPQTDPYEVEVPGIEMEFEANGIVQDRHSGVDTVAWEVQPGGQQGQAVVTQIDAVTSQWKIDKFKLPTGRHVLTVIARDRAGKESRLSRSVVVAKLFDPKDPEDVVSPLAYLDDLIVYAQRRLVVAEPDLDPAPKLQRLAETFHQSFADLVDPAFRVTANREVSQVRVGIEVLRRYLANQQNPAVGLVANWKLEEGNGNVAGDSSGNKIEGTVQGAQWVADADRNGQVLEFDGADDVVTVAANPLLKDVTNNFTLAFWAKPDAQIGADTEMTGGTGGCFGQKYAIAPEQGDIAYGSGHAGAGVSVGTNGVKAYEHAANYLPALLVYDFNNPVAGWIHIIVVYRDKRPWLYIDGQLVKIGQSSSPKAFVHIFPGGHGDASGLGGMLVWGHYKGRLDDVRIYNQALSEDAIATLYAGQPLDSASILTPAEVAYRQAAYEGLLSRVGTSYTEIRLARNADDAARQTLANRLGVDFSPSLPETERFYNLLRLEPDQITEANLQRLFGLPPTTGDPLRESTPRDPDLLVWRRAHLRTLWRQQDEENNAGSDDFPIIEPDLMDASDLANPVAGNPAFELWKERRETLKGRVEALTAARKAADAPNVLSSAVFDQIVSGVLGPVAELKDLANKRKQGQSIEADLKQKNLTLPALSYLLVIEQLASTSDAENPKTVLETEWNNVEAILVQSQKQKLNDYATWRGEEKQKNLVLGPDDFRAASLPLQLPAWRATQAARQSWEDTLRARTEQDLAAAQALQAAVSATEDATLPPLREALVKVLGSGETGADPADRLTRRLLVDMKTGGNQRITRVAQAIATLQDVLFSLRTGRLVGSGTEAWKIGSEQEFDQEWKWMGSHATWRAAIFVFGYPENLLLPGLRKEAEQSLAFNKLIKDLLQNWQLTPSAARARAADYRGDLASPLALPAGFTITEENYTADTLRQRRNNIEALWNANQADSTRLREISEIFYFVPMYLGLQLQKAGQYVAALDWFQTIYAYNLPVAERKIYFPLEDEKAIPTTYSRTDKWMTENDGLNPHDIAGKRANAYTRFTLMSLVRCLLDFADAEFTRETIESLPRARSLYLTALSLLDSDDMKPPTEADGSRNPFPPNPVVQALRQRAELNLFKLRNDRNIAGMERRSEPELPASQTSLPSLSSSGQIVLPGVASIRPTPYYYAVLIERTKQLVALAQQIEASYLSALVQTDVENYNRFKANLDLELSQAGVQLQNLRVNEAVGGITLASLQQQRAAIQAEHYEELLDEGISGLESASLTLLKVTTGLQLASAAVSLVSAFLPASVSVGFPGGVSASVSPQGSAGAIASSLSSTAAATSTTASITSTYASYERRRQEWELQKGLADKDVEIGSQQVRLAQDRVSVVSQERRIAQTQANQAQATVDFLDNKFLNSEMYAWMSGVLAQVYRYFLQQAAAMAQLAQNQLAFERQETPPSYIQSDYWQPPSDAGLSANGDGRTPDRRGLTGSARLLQDIYQLDNYAFETDKRKLQLAQTFSLARLAPLEFQRFRQTGTLPFATTLEMFDRSFPGHYLRLIKRVRTSVIALIPPTQGIRATLLTNGISRVVSGGDVFQTVVVRRDPQLVALTSPSNATGLFELDMQSNMLLPFEGLGVDTFWELQMPKAANPFDYRTIADVLITVEYTALNSFDYRQKVVQALKPDVDGDRAFSIRNELPDEWYNLQNPEQVDAQQQMIIALSTTRADFPPNMEDLKIRRVSLYVIWRDGETAADLNVNLQFAGSSGARIGEDAQASAGVARFTSFGGVPPTGDWEVELENTPEVWEHFQSGRIEDVLFVITYTGRQPGWPM